MSTDVRGGFGAPFSWSVSTPEGIVASGQCEFLVVPTTGGELGVLAGHAALVAGVLPGDLRVTSTDANPPGTSTRLRTVSVGGGVVEVRDNQVRLLVTHATA
jgi:F-type H+-transporting ATPase subunit epsilon